MEENKVERPMHHLAKVCYNCKYFRRKKTRMHQRFGFCIIIEFMDSFIKSLPKKEKRLHYDQTPIDGTCDWHLFKGKRAKIAYDVTGITPL